MHYKVISLAAFALLACAADSPGAQSAPGSPGEVLDAGVTGGESSTGSGAGSGSGAGAGSGEPQADAGPLCKNLQCRQLPCAAGGATTVSGVVYDPAGVNPLYNAVVYVPNEAVQPLKQGASCDTCDSLFTGSPIAATVTDAAGKFTLTNVPEGADVPLVIQIGKWRRQLTLPMVVACQDNPQPKGALRLPKNRSEGDIPNIAVSTGNADTLECLLRRIGLDASEYVPGAGGEGRVHIFQGANEGGLFGGNEAPNTSPAAPQASAALWTSAQSLLAYDIVLLSCEGDETEKMNQQALHDYGDAGGRVFASHFHYAWFNEGPFGSENLASWSTGSNDIGDISGTIVTTQANGQPFLKGQALAAWLGNVGALTDGKLPISQARHNADVTAANSPSQTWILADEDSDAPGAAQYFSFNTPVAAGSQPDAAFCGRVVYSDLHVGAASEDDPEEPVPTGCADRKLSPQEAALEFMLFDLSSCVTPGDVPTQPPPVVLQ